MSDPRNGKPDRLDTLVGVRLHPTDVKALDAWADAQRDQPTRPEAVRRLIRKALGGRSRARL